ncbi:MAG: hypothetical protein FWD33_03940 [Alphaproteobacteria bacterium]|nr:hypothetical protein [Alphaproteobacteria bacterium]
MGKIGFILSKKDLKLNYDKFGKSENVLFVTGIFGAGKTYTGQQYSKNFGAIHISQDWLGWAECYDCKHSRLFKKMFYDLYPTSKKYFDKNSKNYQKYKTNRIKFRPLWDDMIVRYAKKNPNKLFVLEGSDLYSHSNMEMMAGKPLIIKRTSLLKCMANMIKRKGPEGSFFKRYSDIQKLHKKLGLTLREERKRCNYFIKKMVALK